MRLEEQIEKLQEVVADIGAKLGQLITLLMSKGILDLEETKELTP
jgi:hypothetical protein